MVATPKISLSSMRKLRAASPAGKVARSGATPTGSERKFTRKKSSSKGSASSLSGHGAQSPSSTPGPSTPVRRFTRTRSNNTSEVTTPEAKRPDMSLDFSSIISPSRDGTFPSLGSISSETSSPNLTLSPIKAGVVISPHHPKASGTAARFREDRERRKLVSEMRMQDSRRELGYMDSDSDDGRNESKEGGLEEGKTRDHHPSNFFDNSEEDNRSLVSFDNYSNESDDDELRGGGRFISKRTNTPSPSHSLSLNLSALDNSGSANNTMSSKAQRWTSMLPETQLSSTGDAMKQLRENSKALRRQSSSGIDPRALHKVRVCEERSEDDSVRTKPY